jgi:hypothetical protein
MLGEDGQRLTILSVLPRVPPDVRTEVADAELSLREAIDQLFRIAGEDGQARVVLDVRVRADDQPEFTTEQNLSLRELADRLYGSFGSEGQATAVLRTLSPDDELFGQITAPDQTGAEDDRGPLAALRRLREAAHRLFGGSAEEGTPPTVLSLLVNPTPATDHRS